MTKKCYLAITVEIVIARRAKPDEAITSLRGDTVPAACYCEERSDAATSTTLM